MARRKRTLRTPEEYAKLIEENGFISLEVVYKLRDNPLVECKKCGHVKRKKVQSIIHARHGCAKCAGNERLSTKEFAQYVKDNADGYELLSEVKGAFKETELRCNKGHEYKVKPIAFIHKGRRCPQCHYESIRGEGHWNYNADLTQEERETMRAFPGYTRWQQDVKARDNYTCQCCGDKRGGNLVSHHLDGWDSHKDKRLDTDNGVTLCEECHRDFHGNYGYGGNTKDQYDEWVTTPTNQRRFLYAEKESEAI